METLFTSRVAYALYANDGQRLMWLTGASFPGSYGRRWSFDWRERTLWTDRELALAALHEERSYGKAKDIRLVRIRRHKS